MITDYMLLHDKALPVPQDHRAFDVYLMGHPWIKIMEYPGRVYGVLWYLDGTPEIPSNYQSASLQRLLDTVGGTGRAAGTQRPHMPMMEYPVLTGQTGLTGDAGQSSVSPGIKGDYQGGQSV